MSIAWSVKDTGMPASTSCGKPVDGYALDTSVQIWTAGPLPLAVIFASSRASGNTSKLPSYDSPNPGDRMRMGTSLPSSSMKYT